MDRADLIASVVHSLSTSLTYPDLGNFETNRRLWNRYAEDWNPDKQWVGCVAEGSEQLEIAVLGDEWSRSQDLDEIVQEYILPYVSSDSSVCEIGVGGGRVASRVLSLGPRAMTCIDIAESMLRKAKERLGDTTETTSVRYVLLNAVEYPADLRETIDFAYCFDVLPHVDLHTMFKTFQQIYQILKPGAKSFFSTANLLTPGGWKRFAAQDKYTVGGFHFTCPAMTDKLLTECGFCITKRSMPETTNRAFERTSDKPRNIYNDRDYLVIAEKRKR